MLKPKLRYSNPFRNASMPNTTIVKFRPTRGTTVTFYPTLTKKYWTNVHQLFTRCRSVSAAIYKCVHLHGDIIFRSERQNKEWTRQTCGKIIDAGQKDDFTWRSVMRSISVSRYTCLRMRLQCQPSIPWQLCWWLNNSYTCKRSRSKISWKVFRVEINGRRTEVIALPPVLTRSVKITTIDFDSIFGEGCQTTLSLAKRNKRA